MTGEELRKARKRADNDIALIVARLRGSDPEFRAALDRGIELDEEADRRASR
jgi:hypothetical protein